MFTYVGATLTVAASAFACNAILDNPEGELVASGGTGAMGGNAGTKSSGGTAGNASSGKGGNSGGSSGSSAGGQGASAGSSVGGGSGEAGDTSGGTGGNGTGGARGGTGGTGGSTQAGRGGTGGTSTAGEGGEAGMAPMPPENCEDTSSCDPIPVTSLTDPAGTIISFSVSSGVVYALVSSAGATSVYKVPTSGGSLSTLGMTSGVTNIHVDGSYVYGTEGGTSTVYRMPIIGTMFTSWGTTSAYGFAMRSNSSALFVGSTLSSYYIQSLQKSDATKFVLVNSLQINATEFEVDETHAYFMDSAGTVVSRNPVDSMASEPVTTAGPGEKIAELALDGGILLFASDTRVATAPGSGGDAVTLDDGAAFGLQAAAGVAYFFRAAATDPPCTGGAALYSVEKADKTKRHLADEAGTCPTHFAQDGNAIYWITADQRSISKALK